MSKRTLYYILLYAIPVLWGIVLSVVSFFWYGIIAVNVTIVGIGGALILWSCFLATTYILGKYLFEIGNNSPVLSLFSFLGSKEYNPILAFFVHAGIVIVAFMIPGSIVYWVLTFWPWM